MDLRVIFEGGHTKERNRAAYKKLANVELELTANDMYRALIAGDSMRPILRENRDVAIVDSVRGVLSPNDVVLYKRPDGQYVLHRILNTYGNYYVTCGDNRWKREKIPFDWAIGVMKGFYNDDEYIDVTDKAYQRYSKLWCRIYPLRAAWLWLRHFFQFVKEFAISLTVRYDRFIRKVRRWWIRHKRF